MSAHTRQSRPPVTDGERAGIQGWPNLASRLEAATIGVNRAVRKPPAQEVRMGMDQLWAEAEPLGLLGKVFDQDTFNMERGQWGLESTRQPNVTFAAYVEDGICLHRRLDDYLAQRTGRLASSSPATTRAAETARPAVRASPSRANAPTAVRIGIVSCTVPADVPDSTRWQAYHAT